MKKLIFALAASSVVFLLSACGSTNVSLEEVFNKSVAASAELESFSVNMVIDQEMSSSSAPEEVVTSNITTDMDIFADPMSLYQTIKMDMDIGGTAQSMNMESYFTPEGFFTYDDITGQWTKLPKEMYDQVMQMSEQQTDPSAQLEQLQKFAEDFSIKEDGSNYILTLNASGEKFMELIKDLSLGGLDMGAETEEILENVTIDELDYTITVDKTTFLPAAVDMTLNMKMDVEGEVINVKQTSTGTYSNLNEVEEIVIPQEVLDTAVEADM